MENVHHDKKQLVSVWKSSLDYLHQKDLNLHKAESELDEMIRKEAKTDNEKKAVARKIAEEEVDLALHPGRRSKAFRFRKLRSKRRRLYPISLKRRQ